MGSGVGLRVGLRVGALVGMESAVTSHVILLMFKNDRMVFSEDWLNPSAALLMLGSITCL